MAWCLATETLRRALPATAEPICSLNATGLERLLGMVAKDTNQHLAACGLQIRNPRGEWELTNAGLQWTEALPYCRGGHSRIPDPLEPGRCRRGAGAGLMEGQATTPTTARQRVGVTTAEACADLGMSRETLRQLRLRAFGLPGFGGLCSSVQGCEKDLLTCQQSLSGMFCSSCGPSAKRGAGPAGSHP
jgi:hypothetical protein